MLNEINYAKCSGWFYNNDDKIWAISLYIRSKGKTKKLQLTL